MPPDSAPVGSFMIIVLPDTQYTVGGYPAIYTAQMNYIADNAVSLGAEIVVHNGDLVFAGGDEWATAAAGFDTLDGINIPYLISHGNHDADNQATRDLTTFNANFGQSRYTGKSWWNGGFYEANKSQNAYNIITIGGIDYLFIVLEYGPRDGALAWAGNLLAINSTIPAIVFAHCYMFPDGTRTSSGDIENPNDAGMGTDVNDGEEMWQNELKRHDNIIWIHSAHHTGGTSSRRQDLSNGGETVNQIFSNYQTIGDGGDGYMRFLTFDPQKLTVKTQTWSPYLEAFYNADEQFTVSYSFSYLLVELFANNIQAGLISYLKDKASITDLLSGNG